MTFKAILTSKTLWKKYRVGWDRDPDVGIARLLGHATFWYLCGHVQEIP